MTKVQTILGHFNPETSRRTNERTLRSKFGRSLEQNCVFQPIYSNKNSLDIKFWFGGRV